MTRRADGGACADIIPAETLLAIPTTAAAQMFGFTRIN
jgi:hypothetical protein